ncbi:M2 family metallopeptidase [Dokdonella koreensis]|uniref:Dipeptidyl carboxypeptidase n=1 Tax=Dokdonella koreensis DS-123 TaxID=1300342 RepID=A0A160DT69_9GAMM|nr:M2 family metallopeptidase [Dokdonella koreensis]ANB17548.1 Dipeptidyl carboxypeptidase [Dokdonella koreensis DS-123]
MNVKLLAAALLAALAGACAATAPRDKTTQAAPGAGSESADAFVGRVNDAFRATSPEMNAAQWLAVTYINEDSQLLAAKSNERSLTQLNAFVEEARRYDGQALSADTARSIALLKLATAMPAPKDPAKLAELARIASKLEGAYGAGTYCRDHDGKRQCRQLGELEDVLRDPKASYEDQLDAWTGWHTIAQPMRADYRRFAELVNEGAREMGFADAGAMWRSGYDMDPDAFRAETDRLWEQVKPLYSDLQCYVRGKLEKKYGARGHVDGLLPAHLTGNMWQQDWGNLWPILEPYKGAGSLDITGALEKQRAAELRRLRAGFKGRASAEDSVRLEREADLAIARSMTERAEDFYTSLGMPKLPESFWTKAQLVKPRDRDVVCHASAWDMNMTGDVRIKMCIKPNEEDLTTIYHELGHVYYYLAYNDLPPLFQSGANDGFHEAIGDTVVLALTPDYLQSVGLVGKQRQSEQAVINAQMRMALAKVAFLPFGLMIDRWRWGVFDGSIAPDQYNSAWWDLKARYQGVAPATARDEAFFDPGAKYHVPGNTPYTRYFLAHILQFQFYRALCDAAGYEGPLHACSFYGNKEAGQKFWSMLKKGQSQPWPETLKELTGSGELDATAILDYFAPLQAWLKQQNQGRQCGW